MPRRWRSSIAYSIGTISDEHYNRRRELTTVVTLACRQHDAPLFLHLGRLRARTTPRLGRDALDLGDGTLEVRS